MSADDLSQRTFDDYMAYLPPLKAFFGAMLPTEVEPNHVDEYLEIGQKAGRGVRAKREKARLSSCFSWMLRSPLYNAGLKVNPCMSVSGIRCNPGSKRERHVTNAESGDLRGRRHVGPADDGTHPENAAAAGGRRSGLGAGQHPQESRWRGPAPRQSKTSRLVDIALVGRLGELARAAIGAVPQLHQPIVHVSRSSIRKKAVEAYTYDGLSSMLKRARRKAGVASFGFRDLKGKRATDMWIAGVPIEQIQLLCGHADKKTTGIYIKTRWTETASQARWR